VNFREAGIFALRRTHTHTHTHTHCTCGGHTDTHTHTHTHTHTQTHTHTHCTCGGPIKKRFSWARVAATQTRRISSNLFAGTKPFAWRHVLVLDNKGDDSIFKPVYVSRAHFYAKARREAQRKVEDASR